MNNTKNDDGFNILAYAFEGNSDGTLSVIGNIVTILGENKPTEIPVGRIQVEDTGAIMNLNGGFRVDEEDIESVELTSTVGEFNYFNIEKVHGSTPEEVNSTGSNIKIKGKQEAIYYPESFSDMIRRGENPKDNIEVKIKFNDGTEVIKNIQITVDNGKRQRIDD